MPKIRWEGVIEQTLRVSRTLHSYAKEAEDKRHDTKEDNSKKNRMGYFNRVFIVDIDIDKLFHN